MIERLLAEEICNNWKNYLIIREENTAHLPEIERVIFNEPATIVLWKDKTKTVVMCQPEDTYSKETGLALCIVKKLYGNSGKYNDIFKKYIN